MQMGLQDIVAQRVLVGMGPVSLPAYRALALSAAALPMGVHSSTAASVAACRHAQAGPFHPVKARFLCDFNIKAAAGRTTAHSSTPVKLSPPSPAHLKVHAAKHARPAALLHVVADCGPGQSDIRLGYARINP